MITTQEYDRLLRDNIPIIAWYLFTDTINYFSFGISDAEFKEDKESIKKNPEITINPFLHSEKIPIIHNVTSRLSPELASKIKSLSQKSKIKSKLISFNSNDTIKIISNNRKLAQYFKINDTSLQKYNADLKAYLVQKSSPISTFIYVKAIQHKLSGSISLRLSKSLTKKIISLNTIFEFEFVLNDYGLDDAVYYNHDNVINAKYSQKGRKRNTNVKIKEEKLKETETINDALDIMYEELTDKGVKNISESELSEGILEKIKEYLKNKNK